MSGRKVAVVGAGMTKFMRRALETPKELSWLAAKSALGDERFAELKQALTDFKTSTWQK